MFKIIIEFFSLLTPSQRKQFYALQILIVIMTFVEILSILSIVPFMALIGDISILEKNNLLTALYLKSNLEEYEFVFYTGIFVLVSLTIAAIVSIYIAWRLAMFAPKIGAEIAHRLYSYYLDKDLLFHTSGSSSYLTKKIAIETERVYQGILSPLMQMNARIVLVFSIVFIMFLYDPIVIIISLIVFSTVYIILFKFVRTRLEKNGQNISNMLSERFRLMSDSFGGIKDVLLLGRSNNFKKIFSRTSNKLANSEGNNIAIGLVPRYFMELIAFGTMIVLVLYLIKTSQGDLSLILPIISVYALAGMKLLPALLSIYSCAATVKGNLSAYEAIREDLKNTNLASIPLIKDGDNMGFKNNEICLKEVTFTYPGKKNPTLQNLSLTIKSKAVVGIVGTSGSGKSTLIDIITGLIKPQKGEVIIDGIPLAKHNLRQWQNKIGYVPQTIFLTEGTIAENVAFGIPKEFIDYEQVKKALKLANLDEFVSKLGNGVYSKVGERGVQISGGQRQRVGIARMLYYKTEVLIFDEATSALDGITEKVIMDAIHDFTGQKTLIIIAHRLKTIQKCDEIFMIEKGHIIDMGTYQYLLENNEQFKKMSDHA